MIFNGILYIGTRPTEFKDFIQIDHKISMEIFKRILRGYDDGLNEIHPGSYWMVLE